MVVCPLPPKAVAGLGVRVVGPGSDSVLRVENADVGGLLSVRAVVVQGLDPASTVPGRDPTTNPPRLAPGFVSGTPGFRW